MHGPSRLPALVLTITLLVLSTSTAAAGWLVVSSDGDTLLISQGKMKQMSEGLVWILDGNKGEVLYINPHQKMYTGGTVEQMCAEFSAMIDASMAALTPELRKMAEESVKARKKKSPPAVKVIAKGKGGRIAGMETEKYDITADGKLYEEVWLASDKTLVEETRPLVRTLPRFLGCMRHIEFPVEASPEYAKLLEKGWEMKSVSHEGDASPSSTEVIALSKKSIPDAAFAVPPGYTKVPLPQLMKTVGMDQGEGEEEEMEQEMEQETEQEPEEQQ